MTYGKIKVDKIQSSAEELTLPTSAGTSGQVLTSNGSGVLSFADNATGTDLTATADGTSLTVASSSGNNVALPAATSSAWGVMSDEDKTKLDGIESSSTADQTGAEIKAAYEAESDTNAFTDADHSKLDGIESSATADQTNAEIRAAVEAATDSNVFTDADHTKLNGIATSANNYALSADLLDEDDFASDSATKAASQQSIKAYVDTEVAGLIDSSPASLDTLNELAAALGDDSNYAATVTTSLGLKAPLASPAFTGDATLAGDLTINTDALFVDASTKKVGIGVAVPVRDLQLHASDASSELMLSNSTTGATADSGFMIQQDGNDTYIWNKEDSFMSFATDATERMRIDSSGNVGIGTASPGSYNGAADNLVIKDSADAGITIRSGSSGAGGIYFNDTDDGNQRGIIRFDHGTDALAFHTPAGESMRINSSGSLLIGGTLPASPATTITAAGAITTAGAATFGGSFDLSSSTGYGTKINIESGSNNYGAVLVQADGNNTFYAKLWEAYNGSSRTSYITASGAATFAGSVTDSKGDVRSIPQNSKSASYTPADRTDVGKHIYTDSAVVINNSVTWVAGDAITLVNKHASNDVTITFTNITAYLAGDAAAKATITVAARGVGTILFTTATECFISGAGVS